MKSTTFGLLSVLVAPWTAAAEDFSVIALPDTQFYSQDYPDTYVAQTQWIADQVVARNIKFVTHLGDIVNEGATLWQWDNASYAMAILDNADVPYGTCVGNHDIHYPGDYYDPYGTNYLNYFGPQYYEDKPWFAGASPSGLSNYQIVEADGREWLFLHLLIETPAEELAWAQTVLNEHRDKPTWVSTHRYLFDWYLLGAGRYQDWNYVFEPPYRDDGVKADDFYHNFIAVNRQVYLVHCGHNDGEHRQVSTNIYGLPVYEILADYQDTYGNGGNGWLRDCSFQPENDLIEVVTYSPTLNDFLNEEGVFTLGVDFDAYQSDSPFLRFQQDSGGYAGTSDTWINEDSKSSSYGGNETFEVDDDTANSWFGEYQGQALVRFDDIFQDQVYEGDPVPTRIPTGSTIQSATLTLNLTDDTRLGNPEYYVYRMTRDWSESSTWNSLSNGIVVGDDTDGTLLDLFYGDNDPDFDYNRFVDIAAAVQAWSDGAANYGLAILPQPIDFNDDGITVRSSENSETALRPALDVEFSYDVINVAPSITAYLTASPGFLNEGSEAELTFGAADPNPLDPLVFLLDEVDVGYATGSGTIGHFVLFEDEGTFMFEAEVRDDEVSVPAGQTTVVVLNVAPSVIEITPDRTVDVDRVFVISAQAADPGILDEISYSWDLDDDGQFDDLAAATGEWSLADFGSHILSVEVSDDDGGVNFAETNISVKDLPADGDFRSDGMVDLSDFAAFQECAFGPNQLPDPPSLYTPDNCLSAFDFDNDDDVDLHDFAEFQVTYSDS